MLPFDNVILFYYSKIIRLRQLNAMSMFINCKPFAFRVYETLENIML